MSECGRPLTEEDLIEMISKEAGLSGEQSYDYHKRNADRLVKAWRAIQAIRDRIAKEEKDATGARE